MFSKTREFIIRQKIRFQRSQTWLGLFMLFSLVADRLSDYLGWSFLKTFIIGAIVLYLFGYVDEKIKFHSIEQRRRADLNPKWDYLMRCVAKNEGKER